MIIAPRPRTASFSTPAHLSVPCALVLGEEAREGGIWVKAKRNSYYYSFENSHGKPIHLFLFSSSSSVWIHNYLRGSFSPSTTSGLTE